MAKTPPPRRYNSDDPERDVADLVARCLPKAIPIYVGVDPGMNGAFALMAGDPAINPVILDMPYLENKRVTSKGGVKKVGIRRVYDLHKLVCWLDPLQSDATHLTTMCLEKVHGRPEDTAITAFSMGCGYNIWPMWATIFNISYHTVMPNVWKRRIGLANAEKETSIAEAKKLFPRVHHYFQIKGDDGRAEALLLAEYGRRLRSGQIAAEQIQREADKKNEKKQK